MEQGQQRNMHPEEIFAEYTAKYCNMNLRKWKSHSYVIVPFGEAPQFEQKNRRNKCNKAKMVQFN